MGTEYTLLETPPPDRAEVMPARPTRLTIRHERSPIRAPRGGALDARRATRQPESSDGPGNKGLNVTTPIDIGPLRLTIDPARGGSHRWRFEFLRSAAELGFEVPGDFERDIAARLRPLLESGKPTDVRLDLAGVTGISSRQLGVMIALQKALREQASRLQLENLHPAVRRLLDVTHTLQFFEVAE